MNWVLLTKVPDLIMRGALVTRLGEEGVEVYVPDRDVIVNVGTGPNLSLEGYSALFDGYSVYVDRKKFAEAQKVLQEIEAQSSTRSTEPVDYAKKFYFASIMCMIMPFLMHALAIYHLFRAVKARQPLSTVKTLFSLFIFISTLFFVPFYFKAGIGFLRAFFA